jgi:hypothetical protein
MGLFDRTCRYVARHVDTIGFLTWLLGADSGLVFSRWMDTRTAGGKKKADRTGDLIAEMAEGGIGRPC